MSYIGRGIDQIDNISTLDNLSFNGSLQTFNLTQNSVAFVPVSADALQIQIDGVIQSGNYTVSGSTVTFDFTPSGSSVCNGIRHYGVGLLTTVSDSSITTAKLGADAVTTAKINDGAVTSGKIASGVIPASRPNVNPIIINGNMAVAQRGTSTSSITGGGYYTVDRWKLNMSSLGTWTQTQNTLSSSDTPFTHGFTKSLKMDCTTADGSPSANDDCQIYYLPEGQDLQLLKKGTANAEKITIGFWIKATKTGTNILAIYDRDNNRLNSQSYSVSSSDTWEYKVVNFPADTTGVIDNDNNKSFELRWVLGLGSTYTGGTLQTTWATYSDANYGVGQINNADSTSNNWEITGVQLEVGEYTSSTIPPFQHESFADNLSRCQRYYYQITGTGKARFANGNFFLQAMGDVMVPFPCKMRAAYSLSTSATSDIMVTSVTQEADCTAVVLDLSNSLDAADVRFTVGSNIGTVGQVSTMILKDSGSYLAFDTEL